MMMTPKSWMRKFMMFDREARENVQITAFLWVIVAGIFVVLANAFASGFF